MRLFACRWFLLMSFTRTFVFLCAVQQPPYTHPYTFSCSVQSCLLISRASHLFPSPQLPPTRLLVSHGSCALVRADMTVVLLLLLPRHLNHGSRLHDDRPPRIRRLLGATLGTRTTALDAPGFRALQVVRGDPFFGVALGGSSGDCGTVGGDVDGLGFLDGLLSAPGALLLLELGEVGHDPDVVEGVADADGAGEEEEVEEDPEGGKKLLD